MRLGAAVELPPARLELAPPRGMKGEGRERIPERSEWTEQMGGGETALVKQWSLKQYTAGAEWSFGFGLRASTARSQAGWLIWHATSAKMAKY